MKTKSSGAHCRGYRLSPNEEARVIQEETEKRRKLRLLQVRELSKHNAASIRQSVKAEKQKQIQKLAKKVEEELECVKEEKVRALEARYDNCVRTIGVGHREAGQQEDRTEELLALAERNNRKADLRYKQALELLQTEKEKQTMEEKYHILARKAALEVEKVRSNHIASLPPPPPDPTLDIGKAKHKPVKMTDASAFSLTHFHMAQDVAVERENPELQADARVSAVDEAERIQEEQRKIEQGVQERRERARVRHVHAREKELLKQDYEHMLHDLSDLQRADMYRRQKVVADIPKQVFQPPHRRLEDRQDKQRTMEQAFEDMYMKATDYTGDLSLALDPYTQTESPTATDALEVSALSDQDDTHDVSNTQTDKPQPIPQLPRSEILKDVTNIAKETSGQSPRKSETVLKKLFNQIKSQRDDWITRSSQDVPEHEDIVSMSPQLFRKYQEGLQDGCQQTDQEHDKEPKTLPSPPGVADKAGHEELSPPVKEYQNDLDVDDRQPAGRPAVSLHDDHERCVEEARRELQEIQDKKAALEEKLKMYSEQQQQQVADVNSEKLIGNLGDMSLAQRLNPEKDLEENVSVDDRTFRPGYTEPPKDVQKYWGVDLTTTMRGNEQPCEDVATDTTEGQEDGQLATETSIADQSGFLEEKLKETHEPDHVRRIKEYQQRLLERHQSWKMLADTRAEIEQRRNELRKRYPHLNFPQMEKLPLPTAGSWRSTLPGSLVSVRSRDPAVSSSALTRPSLPGEPRTSKLTGLAGLSSFYTASQLQPSGVMASSAVAMTTDGPPAVTMGTSRPTGDQIVTEPPASKIDDPKADNVRKQLLFDSETPVTSPEKFKTKSPMGGRKDLDDVPQILVGVPDVRKSEPSTEMVKDLPTDIERVKDLPTSIERIKDLPTSVQRVKDLPTSNKRVEDLPTAVPLGQSRVRKKIHVSPKSVSPAEDRSLDHSEIDPIVALTEAAKERKLYFEKRQQQLTEQLEEIQTQKAAYLSRHEDSQRQLTEHRQRVLREIIHSLPLAGLKDDGIGPGQSGEKSESQVTVQDLSGSENFYPESLQNVSITSSDNSQSRRTWADLLHDESMGNADIDKDTGDPVSLLNGSLTSIPGSHRPHELSTIIEVDTPPQSKSLSSSRRRSSGEEAEPTDTLLHHHMSAEPTDTLSHRRQSAESPADMPTRTGSGLTSQMMSVPPPPSYDDVRALQGYTGDPDFDLGYEPLSDGMTLTKSDDFTFKTVREASAAVARAHELLAKTSIPSFSSSSLGQHHYDSMKSTSVDDSGSDYISATSGSRSHPSAEFSATEVLIAKPESKDSFSGNSAWRSPDLRRESSPHSSELTQYSAPSESAQSNGSESGKSADNLTQYTAYSSELLKNHSSNGTVWRSEDRHFSPSGVSELTQYSTTSNASQDSSAKEPIPSQNSDKKLSGENLASFGSPADWELTQFSDQSEKSGKSAELLTASKKTSDPALSSKVALGEASTDVSGSRPKSAASISGSELTQYSCSPTLELNAQQESRPEQQLQRTAKTGTSAPGVDQNVTLQSASQSQNFKTGPAQTESDKDGSKTLLSLATSADKRATVSRESMGVSDLTQYSASLEDGSWERDSGNVARLNKNNSRLFDEQIVAANKSANKYEPIPPLLLSQNLSKSKKNEADVFRAVKVFIEPPNDQSSPQETERSGRDRTRGSSISQSLGMDERSGPSESSSYMTLPSMTRPNPLAMADFSAFGGHYPGEFHAKANSFDSFGSSGYQPLSEDSWKMPGLKTNTEDSLTFNINKWKRYLQMGNPDKSQVSLGETGITDEADLTLVSSASITSPSRLYNDSQSDSLVSFERHEASVDDIGVITPRRKIDHRHDDIILYLEPGDELEEKKAGVTLQEGLLAKKKSFASASERRVLEAKDKAKEKTKTVKDKGRSEQPTSGLTKTLASWKKSRAIKVPTKASPGRSQLSQKTKTTPDRKKQEKDKLERTKRLYNQLDEVKERNQVKEREKQYAANRDKAKQYHKKMQEKLKKQRVAKT